MEYDLSTSIIQYNTTNEYRRVLRKLFFMDCVAVMQTLEEKYKISDLDDETLDELLYDETKMNNALTLLFDKTKDHPTFQTLYENAAALMFSQDNTIGQCVLCSYDYLGLYHSCLFDFFINNHFDNNCESFISLYSKLKN